MVFCLKVCCWFSCFNVLGWVDGWIDRLSFELIDSGICLVGTLIKPSFPQPGLKHPSRGRVTPQEIALATATVLSRAVPTAVPGVVFLSGKSPSLFSLLRVGVSALL